MGDKMQKAVEQLVLAFDEIRYYLNEDIKWFESILPRVKNCFVFIQKHVMIARDLLKYYGEDWSGVEILLKKDEYVERLTMVALSAFILSLSAVEYGLKLIIGGSRTGPLVEWSRRERAKAAIRGRKYRMYLSRIIRESSGSNLLDATEYESWMGIIGLRNVIMHNNAIVEEDTSFDIGKLVIPRKHTWLWDRLLSTGYSVIQGVRLGCILSACFPTNEGRRVPLGMGIHNLQDKRGVWA